MAKYARREAHGELEMKGREREMEMQLNRQTSVDSDFLIVRTKRDPAFKSGDDTEYGKSDNLQQLVTRFECLSQSRVD